VKYRSLVDNAPDTIARFDRSLRHVFINMALC
jgi:PAS domain-containing protein